MLANYSKYLHLVEVTCARTNVMRKTTTKRMVETVVMTITMELKVMKTSSSPDNDFNLLLKQF